MSQSSHTSDLEAVAPPSQPPGLRVLSLVLSRLETLLATIAAISMLLIMLVVVSDIVMRYFFSRPLVFSYDLISMYLVVVVFFFALPDTLHRHGHIAIDFFQPWLPSRLRFLGEAFGYGTGTAVMALIAWLLTERTWVALINSEVTATTIPWPIWLSNLPAALGSWLFTLRAGYRFIAYVASAVAGRPMVELPPQPLTANVKEDRS